MRKFGLYILAENRRAAIVALICALLPLVGIPIGFFAAVVVGLVTLRKGVKAGLMILAFAILPAICFLIANRADFFYGYYILIAQCILVWLFAIVLQKTLSWRLMLEIATLIGILAVIGVHIFIPHVSEMWINLYQQHMETFPWATVFRGSAAKTNEIIQHASTIATGAVALVGLFFVFVELLLARWWETAIYSPGALKTEFDRIRIDRIAAGILLVATVGLYWKSTWLIDVYPVLLLPFIIGGLSIMHKIASKRKELIVLIIAIYLALFLVPFFAVVLLALIGFIDSWIAFRKRLAWLRQ
jgi:hypothetical protein